MALLEQIRVAVEAGYSKYTEQLIFQALNEGEEPTAIMEEGLIPAMRNIGKRYQSNDSELMQILVTARCMQKGMDILQPYLNQKTQRKLGKVILGTVEGDLHDVGKKLVSVMLKSVGLEVVDLGVDISARQFVKAAKNHADASIVCLSCLLTTSMDAMRRTVHALQEDKELSHLYIMVGGSPITQEFARSIGADAYTENAVDAADVAKLFCMERSGRA